MHIIKITKVFGLPKHVDVYEPWTKKKNAHRRWHRWTATTELRAHAHFHPWTNETCSHVFPLVQVFLVTRSAALQRKVLSVRLEDEGSSPCIQDFPVKESQYSRSHPTLTCSFVHQQVQGVQAFKSVRLQYVVFVLCSTAWAANIYCASYSFNVVT